MWSYLINSIELYSNHKSFSLGIDTVRNLWLLLHFKDLEIKNKIIYYQVDNGIRQRKNTKHPIRKMRKPHKNTAELIEYLSDKPYRLIKLELEFTNGWAIKQLPYIELRFYTNSTQERDELINNIENVLNSLRHLRDRYPKKKVFNIKPNITNKLICFHTYSIA